MTDIKSFMLRHLPEILFVVILGIILFSSINNTHDWGGDFAQYLDNARDLISGSKDQSEEVLQGIEFAPATRGGAFSLLLALIFLIFGSSISNFTLFNSFLFLLSSLIVMRFFQKSGLSTPIAVLLTLIFAMNPAVFELKFEILPSFAFLGLLYLIFSYDQVSSGKQLIYLALLTGILISFRNVGWVCYLAVLMHCFLYWIKHRNLSYIFKVIGFIITVPFIDMIIKWFVFGNSSNENISWYSRAFHLREWQVFWDRLLYNYDQILIFFKAPPLGGTGLLVGKMMIGIMILGWSYRIYQKRWRMADTFVFGYGLLLMLYEGVGGMRFLIPVLPMLLLYWIEGWTFITLKLKDTIAVKIRLAILIALLLLFLPETWKLHAGSKFPISGPNNPAAIEAFSYIKYNLPEQEATAFHKPWVLHYYTGRTSLAINPKKGNDGATMDYLVEKMTRYKVNYLMASLDPSDFAIHNERLVRELRKDPRFSERWQNDAFALFSLEENVNNKKSTLK